jgi:hypothetical protein
MRRVMELFGRYTFVLLSLGCFRCFAIDPGVWGSLFCQDYSERQASSVAWVDGFFVAMTRYSSEPPYPAPGAPSPAQVYRSYVETWCRELGHHSLFSAAIDAYIEFRDLQPVDWRKNNLREAIAFAEKSAGTPIHVTDERSIAGLSCSGILSPQGKPPYLMSQNWILGYVTGANANNPFRKDIPSRLNWDTTTFLDAVMNRCKTNPDQSLFVVVSDFYAQLLAQYRREDPERANIARTDRVAALRARLSLLEQQAPWSREQLAWMEFSTLLAHLTDSDAQVRASTKEVLYHRLTFQKQKFDSDPNDVIARNELGRYYEAMLGAPKLGLSAYAYQIRDRRQLYSFCRPDVYELAKRIRSRINQQASLQAATKILLKWDGVLRTVVERLNAQLGKSPEEERRDSLLESRAKTLLKEQHMSSEESHSLMVLEHKPHPPLNEYELLLDTMANLGDLTFKSSISSIESYTRMSIEKGQTSFQISIDQLLSPSEGLFYDKSSPSGRSRIPLKFKFAKVIVSREGKFFVTTKDVSSGVNLEEGLEKTLIDWIPQLKSGPELTAAIDWLIIRPDIFPFQKKNTR